MELKRHAPKLTRQMTVAEFDRLFPDEDSCKSYLLNQRWPKGVRCPRCGNENVYESKTRPFHWQCLKCGSAKRAPYRFSVTVGTVFENTNYPLRTWFRVLYLMLTSKKGISALQIHRVIFGEKSTHDYHTSWFICMRWRAAMAGDMYQPLSGVVEADETYIGGKDRNRHAAQKSARQRELGIGGHRYGKIGVIGAIQRKGNVVRG